MKKILTLAFIFCTFATISFAQDTKPSKKAISPSERAQASIERLDKTLTSADPALKLTDEQRKELNQYYLSKYAPKINVVKGKEEEGAPAAGELPKADQKKVKKQTLLNILSKPQLSAMAEAKKIAREERAKEKAAAAESKN
ncbi:MAG: hypothetical protein MK226_14840 [Saprospiraceae bacterium]|nr:hypothetical protein [Saprospiraceae bacterium]